MKTNKKGFTLIELLVVIAVIGMLASIVLVSLGPARQKARDARRQSDIRQISLAMELCYDDDACGTGDAYQAVAVNTNGRLTTTSIASYMNPLPQDPGGGSETNCANLTAGEEMAAGAYCGYTNAAGGEYCIYASIAGSSEFFAASEKGAQIMSARPASMAACP